MKRLLILAIFCQSLIAQAMSPELAFQDANKAFVAGDFKKSILLYEQILTENKMASAELYYNLANAYFKLTDYPNAILNYRRALRLDPGDDDIIYNLSVAESRIQDRIEPVPVLFYKRWFIQLRNMFPVDLWATLFIVLLFGSAAFWTLFIVGKTVSRRKLGFYAGITLLILSVIDLGLTWSLYSHRRQTSEAVVFAGSVSVKSSPVENGTSLFVIHSGTYVEIIDHVGEWVRVRIPDGNEGWMPQSELELI